jgi:hypothetical protein
MKKFLFVLFFLAAVKAGAQELKSNEFSVSLGYMFEGEVYIWESDFYGSVGETMLVRLEYDHYFASMGNRFGLGVYYTYGSPWYDGYETIGQHEIGAVLRARLSAGDKLLIKPGAYFGYRAYSDEAGQGLGINGSVAFQYRLNEKIQPFLDMGILSQPAGGNDFSDITYSPVFQINVGIAF